MISIRSKTSSILQNQYLNLICHIFFSDSSTLITQALRRYFSLDNHFPFLHEGILQSCRKQCLEFNEVAQADSVL